MRDVDSIVVSPVRTVLPFQHWFSVSAQSIGPWPLDPAADRTLASVAPVSVADLD